MFTTKGDACGGREFNAAEEESDSRHSIANIEISEVLKVDWFQPVRTRRLLRARQVPVSQGVEELAYDVRHPEIHFVMSEFAAWHRHHHQGSNV